MMSAPLHPKREKRKEKRAFQKADIKLILVLHHWCEGLKFIHKIFFSICLPRHLYHTRVGMVYSASCRKLCHSTKPWVTYCTCMLHLLHIGGCQSNSVTHEGKYQWCRQFLSLQISVDSSIAEFLASFLSA